VSGARLTSSPKGDYPMNMRIPLVVAPALLLLGCHADSMAPTEPVSEVTEFPAQMSKSATGGRAAAVGVVYVSSQGLYYDTFVSAMTLPPHGPFQKLENGVTEFGPGDRGYVGGRWWIDDGNGVQGPEDTYLLCPLLGPGRENP